MGSNPILLNEPLKQSSSNHSFNTQSTPVATLPAPEYTLQVDDKKASSNNSDSSKNSSENTEEKGSWKPPFDLEEASTAGQVIFQVMNLVDNGKEVVHVIKNSEDIESDLAAIEYDTDSLQNVAKYISSKYAFNDEISKEDAAELTEASNVFAETYVPGVDAITNKATRNLGKLQGFKPINTKSPEMLQALNVAYLDSDNSALTELKTIIETAESYNSKGLEVVSYSKRIYSSLGDTKLIKLIDKGGAKFTGVCEKLTELVEVAQDFQHVFLSGSSRDITDVAKSLESMMSLVDKGINLVDTPGLNTIQGLWNYVYKPMVDICVKGVGEIAAQRAGEFRKITEVRINNWNNIKPGEGNTAPTALVGAMNEFFSKSGGWVVFQWLWEIMVGRITSPSEAVIKHFENNFKSINEGTPSEMPYDGIWPAWSIDPDDLKYWAKNEKFKLWGMFYGTNIPFPPSTKS